MSLKYVYLKTLNYNGSLFSCMLMLKFFTYKLSVLFNISMPDFTFLKLEHYTFVEIY